MYNEAFETYYRMIHFRINSMISDPAASDDLTQETFTRLVVHIDELEDMEHVRRWLLTVAHHLTLDYIEKNKRMTLFGDETELFLKEAPGPHRDTTRSMMAADLLHQIFSYIDSWDEQSQYIYLGKLNGRTSKELAKEFGCSASNIDGKYKRLSKRIIKKYLSQWRAIYYEN